MRWRLDGCSGVVSALRTSRLREPSSLSDDEDDEEEDGDVDIDATRADNGESLGEMENVGDTGLSGDDKYTRGREQGVSKM